MKRAKGVMCDLKFKREFESPGNELISTGRSFINACKEMREVGRGMGPRRVLERPWMGQGIWFLIPGRE